jgi:uncharacterized caspase-like protein
MRCCARLAILATLLLGIVQPAFGAKRVALVIGNGHYVNANTLINPPNDAIAVGNKLSDLGFEVLHGVDVGRDEMEKLLRHFLFKAASSEIAILFYAGHGLQVDGRNYLVPVDAKIQTTADLNFGTIDLDKILASLDDPTRANIIILDACRDNPLARSFASRTRTASVGSGLAAYTMVGTGTLVAYSTAPGKVADDGIGVNSPFTTSLLRHIATPGIEVRQMLTRVRSDVATATAEKQIPWDNSSLRGDVYLGGASNVVQPAVASPTVPAIDPAAQAWTAVKDTNSPQVLDNFIQRFGDSFYADLARSRLKELRTSMLPPELLAGD